LTGQGARRRVMALATLPFLDEGLAQQNLILGIDLVLHVTASDGKCDAEHPDPATLAHVNPKLAQPRNPSAHVRVRREPNANINHTLRWSLRRARGRQAAKLAIDRDA